MNKNIIINQLAVKAQEGGSAEFEDLYKAIEPQFDQIIKGYFFHNNLCNFTFDLADYISVIGQAIWEALDGFDIHKGDFMARVITFARRRMKGVTDYNLAEKRFDKSKQLYSFEELYESDKLDVKAPEKSELEILLRQFVKEDKDGDVIEVLLTTTGSKARNKAFTKLFGQYGAKERKRVQRTRERLQDFLTKNYIYV